MATLSLVPSAPVTPPPDYNPFDIIIENIDSFYSIFWDELKAKCTKKNAATSSRDNIFDSCNKDISLESKCQYCMGMTQLFDLVFESTNRKGSGSTQILSGLSVPTITNCYIYGYTIIPKDTSNTPISGLVFVLGKINNKTMLFIAYNKLNNKKIEKMYYNYYKDVSDGELTSIVNDIKLGKPGLKKLISIYKLGSINEFEFENVTTFVKDDYSNTTEEDHHIYLATLLKQKYTNLIDSKKINEIYSIVGDKELYKSKYVYDLKSIYELNELFGKKKDYSISKSEINKRIKLVKTIQ
jgi:hypothetical protein